MRRLITGYRGFVGRELVNMSGWIVGATINTMKGNLS